MLSYKRHASIGKARPGWDGLVPARMEAGARIRKERPDLTADALSYIYGTIF